MSSLLAVVFGVYLVIVLVMVVVGPLLMLRERRRGRAGGRAVSGGSA